MDTKKIIEQLKMDAYIAIKSEMDKIIVDYMRENSCDFEMFKSPLNTSYVRGTLNGVSYLMSKKEIYMLTKGEDSILGVYETADGLLADLKKIKSGQTIQPTQFAQFMAMMLGSKPN